MSTNPPGPADEEAMRAAYEEQMRRIRVEDVLLDNVAVLVNLAVRRSGRVPGAEAERDPAQVQIAIEAVRAQMPLLERVAAEQVGEIREALAQLQLIYVQMGGPTPAGAPSTSGESEAPAEPASTGVPSSSHAGAAPSAAGTPASEPAAGQPPAPNPDEPGPAQRSGRLWVPGQ